GRAPENPPVHSAPHTRRRMRLTVLGKCSWNKAIEKWKQAGPLMEPNSKIAAVRAKDCQKLLADFANAPDAKLVGSYANYLLAIARREGKIVRKDGKTRGV